MRSPAAAAAEVGVAEGRKEEKSGQYAEFVSARGFGDGILSNEHISPFFFLKKKKASRRLSSSSFPTFAEIESNRIESRVASYLPSQDFKDTSN